MHSVLFSDYCKSNLAQPYLRRACYQRVLLQIVNLVDLPLLENHRDALTVCALYSAEKRYCQVNKSYSSGKKAQCFIHLASNAGKTCKRPRQSILYRRNTPCLSVTVEQPISTNQACAATGRHSWSILTRPPRLKSTSADLAISQSHMTCLLSKGKIHVKS